jgi:hypothetical protein
MKSVVYWESTDVSESHLALRINLIGDQNEAANKQSSVIFFPKRRLTFNISEDRTLDFMEYIWYVLFINQCKVKQQFRLTDVQLGHIYLLYFGTIATVF